MKYAVLILFVFFLFQVSFAQKASGMRQRISINDGWKFMRYTSTPDSLIYDERPVVVNTNDNKVADSRPTEVNTSTSSVTALKKWILPGANDFIDDPRDHHQRPSGNPGSEFPFVQYNFNEKPWEDVTLPHDWAIQGPFYKEANAIVGGGMGRLPVHGVAWYRRKLDIPASDTGKKIYLDIDGAMSYAMVWLNGNLVGGWPYGTDLCFITVQIVDSKGTIVSEANNTIKFEVSGPGEIIATDNGNPADLVAFPSKERSAFNGLALVIVRTKSAMPGIIKITAVSEGLTPTHILIKSQ